MPRLIPGLFHPMSRLRCSAGGSRFLTKAQQNDLVAAWEQEEPWKNEVVAFSGLWIAFSSITSAALAAEFGLGTADTVCASS
jgi:hypothetical protein